MRDSAHTSTRRHQHAHPAGARRHILPAILHLHLAPPPRPPHHHPPVLRPTKKATGEPSSAAAGSFTISCTRGRLSDRRPALLPPSWAATCASKASTTRPNTFSTTPAQHRCGQYTRMYRQYTRMTVPDKHSDTHALWHPAQSCRHRPLSLQKHSHRRFPTSSPPLSQPRPRHIHHCCCEQQEGSNKAGPSVVPAAAPTHPPVRCVANGGTCAAHPSNSSTICSVARAAGSTGRPSAPAPAW